MQKEKLTAEHIVADLDRYAERNFTAQDDRPFWGMMASATLAILCGILLRPWVAIPFAVLAVGFLVWQLCIHRRYKKARKAIRARGFTVSSAVLTGITEETAEEIGIVGKRHLVPARFLYFGGEKYRIYGEHYPWSKDFHLSVNGMLNTSVIGDEFWVARDRETEEIGAVYNKKFFDYEP